MQEEVGEDGGRDHLHREKEPGIDGGGLTEPVEQKDGGYAAAHESHDQDTPPVPARDLEARFVDIESSMSDQAVATDPSAYGKLARESKDLSAIVDRFRSYKSLLAEITKIQEMIRSESEGLQSGSWASS